MTEAAAAAQTNALRDVSFAAMAIVALALVMSVWVILRGPALMQMRNRLQ